MKGSDSASADSRKRWRGTSVVSVIPNWCWSEFLLGYSSCVTTRAIVVSVHLGFFCLMMTWKRRGW